MRKKIVFFLPSLEPGGTERNVVNLVNHINKERYVVSLVLGKKEGDFMKEVEIGIPIINLNTSSSLGLLFTLTRYFNSQKPDIFISAFPRINIVSLVAKILSGSVTKIVITEHSVFSMLSVIAKTPWRRTFARFFMPLLSRLMYPRADSIVCVSRGIADDLKKVVGVASNIKVIYNPVIDDNIYQLANEPVHHALFSNQDIPVIIAVGRLVKCKDYPTLLKAFKLIIKKQPAHLVILGRGPEKETLEGIVGQMGLVSQVTFLGFQDNPYKYMSKASVFVLSSLQEGFGNVIIEAMACGTPVVSTNCPAGPGEIIEHMRNGILVPVGDEKKLAEAILEVLNKPALASRFSREGRATAECFSVQKSVAEYEKVFQTLIHNQ